MKISSFDRFLLGLFPKWGANRIRARMVGDVITRHYDAAQPGRRTEGWQRNFGDADLNTRGQSVVLRSHARDLLRNNAWARKAQRTIANNTVGWGISARITGPLAQRASALWRNWALTQECESEGRHTFYGLQHLAVKSVVESGEVLFRRRWRKKKDDLTLPFQIQILEADYLDHSRNLFDSQAGGPIIQGVEFDKLGRRAAYWIFEKHPGSGRNYIPSKRIDASDIIHVYYTERPGQSRGVTWFAPAILNLKDFDEYEDATLLRQKIAACFAAFVTDPSGDNIPLGGPSPDAVNQPLVEAFEPGMIVPLPPGKTVMFANPPTVSGDGFTERQLRRIAAAMGVTYEDMTGDYSQVNFSSARMARLSHWGNVHDWRWNMLIPLLCDGVWNWAMEAAIAVGELPEAAPVTWVPPPMPMIEPEKEGLAYSRLIRNGLMTHNQAVLEQGSDPDSHWPDFKAGLDTLDKLEIILDSDPRKTTAAGMEQQSEVQPPSETTSAGSEKKPVKKPNA